MTEPVIDAMEQQRGAGFVSLGTIGTGFSTVFEILPTVLGCIASLAGLILTVVLIRNGLKKSRILDMELREVEKLK